jgi:hypothetical protein
MGTAHGELSRIQEQDPGQVSLTSMLFLKNADKVTKVASIRLPTLNQITPCNPKDSFCLELLAQIYANNGYHAYAVAASEALTQVSTATLKSILINKVKNLSHVEPLQSDY